MVDWLGPGGGWVSGVERLCDSWDLDVVGHIILRCLKIN